MTFFAGRKVHSAIKEVDVNLSREGAQCHISLSGRITMDSAPDLRARLLKQLEDPGCQHLALDFSEVAYIDTAGVAILVEVLRDARSRHKKFEVSRLQERPRFILQATQVLPLFDKDDSDGPAVNLPIEGNPL